jgi:hypothetical protein
MKKRMVAPAECRDDDGIHAPAFADQPFSWPINGYCTHHEF